MKTLVIIPCYNEEENLDRVVERLHAAAPDVDYLIVNDDLEICVEEMHQIICGEHHRSSRNMGFIQQMKEELKDLKGE